MDDDPVPFQMQSNDQADLASFLCNLHEAYGQYAKKLWKAGVRTSDHLASGGLKTLRKNGITNDLHVDDIKARAGMDNRAELASTCDTKS